MENQSYFKKKWLTLEEASQYLNRCTRQVLRYVEHGNLKGHQPVPNGKWAFDRNDLDSWIMFNNSYSKLTRPQKKQINR